MNHISHGYPLCVSGHSQSKCSQPEGIDWLNADRRKSHLAAYTTWAQRCSCYNRTSSAADHPTIHWPPPCYSPWVTWYASWWHQSLAQPGARIYTCRPVTSSTHSLFITSSTIWLLHGSTMNCCRLLNACIDLMTRYSCLIRSSDVFIGFLASYLWSMICV